MTHMAMLSKYLGKEVLARAVETDRALRDGTYWGVETIYDDQNFPEPPACSVGFGGGDGD
jgi:hypothetical protein